MSGRERPAWALRIATDPADGAGHAVRSAALAAALPGMVRLFLDPGAVPESLRAAGLPCTEEAAPGDTAELTAAVRDGAVDAVVVDSYRVGEQAIAWIAARRPCAVFRDGVPRHGETVAIDPSPLAPEGQPGWLAGPAYAALTPGIRAARARMGLRQLPAETADRHRRLVVAFGARDSADLTGRTLEILATLDEPLDVSAVLGGTAPHLAAVARQIQHLPRARLLVDHADMAGLYATADLAVGAPGVSHLERMCLGVPTVLLAQTEGQRPLARAWAEAGAALAPDDGLPGLAAAIARLMADRPLAQAIATRGQQLVDGDGAERLAAALVHALGLKEPA